MKKITYINFFNIKLNSDIVANIFNKIIDNVIHLHSKDIIHLDLHQDNILIHKKDENEGNGTNGTNGTNEYIPYFIDFEISWDYKNDDF